MCNLIFVLSTPGAHLTERMAWYVRAIRSRPHYHRIVGERLPCDTGLAGPAARGRRIAPRCSRQCVFPICLCSLFGVTGSPMLDAHLHHDLRVRLSCDRLRQLQGIRGYESDVSIVSSVVDRACCPCFPDTAPRHFCFDSAKMQAKYTDLLLLVSVPLPVVLSLKPKKRRSTLIAPLCPCSAEQARANNGAAARCRPRLALRIEPRNAQTADITGQSTRAFARFWATRRRFRQRGQCQYGCEREGERKSRIWHARGRGRGAKAHGLA